jgi:hypothetical protein
MFYEYDFRFPALSSYGFCPMRSCCKGLRDRLFPSTASTLPATNIPAHQTIVLLWRIRTEYDEPEPSQARERERARVAQGRVRIHKYLGIAWRYAFNFLSFTFAIFLISTAKFSEAVMYDLKDQVAIVTGCSSGIGLATTKLFLSSGAKVFGIDVSNMKDEELVQSSSDSSSFFMFHQADLTGSTAAEDAIKACISRFGERIDILANVAGISKCIALLTGVSAATI